MLHCIEIDYDRGDGQTAVCTAPGCGWTFRSTDGAEKRVASYQHLIDVMQKARTG